MGNRAVRKWKKTRMVTAMLAVCSIFFGIIVGCQVKSNEKSEMLPIIQLELISLNLIIIWIVKEIMLE